MMMGERRAGQDALFYEFRLERHVPSLPAAEKRAQDQSGHRARSKAIGVGHGVSSTGPFRTIETFTSWTALRAPAAG